MSHSEHELRVICHSYSPFRYRQVGLLPITHSFVFYFTAVGKLSVCFQQSLKSAGYGWQVSGVWLEERGILVDLRAYTNCYLGDCLSIHALDLPESLQNLGWFKSFLVLCCQLKPWKDIIMEDVGNPHLLGFCQHHGFTVLNDFYPHTFIVDQKRMLGTPVKSLAEFCATS